MFKCPKFLDINKLSHRVAFYIAVLMLYAVVAFGAWHLYRWVNWNLAYGDDVKATVCEMVKPKYLKEGACK